jgi:hypothetical protein
MALTKFIMRIEAEQHFLMPRRGWGQGYVHLPPNHKYWGVDKKDLPDHIQVHGGVTYSKQEDEYWVFGFDTNHAFDTIENCTEEYVLEQTLKLSEQLEL